ncbi:MAG TPA: hypothetical protein VI759_02175 [Dehalococcoidia bacterium]|nr:hypothetical protein [Dehalococcoidia bacterium]
MLVISILLLTSAVTPSTGWFIALTVLASLSLLGSACFGRRAYFGGGHFRRRASIADSRFERWMNL